MLILHYTGMRNAETARNWLSDPISQVSCHYFVTEEGIAVQMVPEERRAWHAGRSVWAGETDINSHSIGIEIVNPGHDWGYTDFPEAQMETVTRLVADIVKRWRIRPDNVLAHSDIAPLRKEDPGERFDWHRLSDAGAGLWLPSAPIRGGNSLGPGDGGRSVEALQGMLAQYGYGIDQTGHYDDLTTAVVRAFQRHFRQEKVDGIADPSTIETLRNLVDLKARLVSREAPRRRTAVS